MGTVRDLIKDALRSLGAIATGETPSADEQADALSSLNDMIESWSLEKLIVPSRVRETFSLVANQKSYTLGPSGNFSTTRPLNIETALLQEPSTPNFELPIEIIPQSEYAGITVKDVTSTIPTKLYIEDTYPLDTLNFWPVPSINKTIVLYSWKALASFASVNDTFALPLGYRRALRYGLAVELALDYNREPSPTLSEAAIVAKANIKRKNIKPNYMAVDPGLLPANRAFNWLTGE